MIRPGRPIRSVAEHRRQPIEVRLRALGALDPVLLGIAALAVQVGVGQFGEEAAGVEAHELAEALLGGGVAQRELFLGAGDADVEQAALLVEAAFLDAALVRQVAVLAADR